MLVNDDLPFLSSDLIRPSCPVKFLLAPWLITSAIEQTRKNLSLICATVLSFCKGI